MTELLFVYGSLKRGYWNNHYMNGCEFLQEAETVNLYALFKWQFPFMVCSTDLQYDEHRLCLPVVGEVWRVDSLDRFDRLEGSMYEREKIPLVDIKPFVHAYITKPDLAKEIRYKLPLCPIINSKYEWSE